MGLFSFLNKDKPLTDEVLASRIHELIQYELNPRLEAHNGSVELVSVKERKAEMRFGGSCQGCAASALTIKLGVEKRIQELIPQIEEVIDVTDHEAGENPYFNQAPEKYTNL